MSTDGSREIARKYPKVILVDNNSIEYDEPERQKLLINEARKIEGPRLLITLDADEMFTPNILHSEEWKNMLQSKPGTIFKFQWANIAPDLKHFWYGYYFPWGYMDDGYEHNYNNKLHNYRIPFPVDATTVEIREIKVIHYQFTDWNIMLSKHRWYQCLEVINYPEKSAVDIYRQYHHMDIINRNEHVLIPNDWVLNYEKLGIELLNIRKENKIWYDEQTLKLFCEYGQKKFHKIDIWDVNWSEISKQWGSQNLISVENPQTIKDALLLSWLRKTQNKLNRKFFRRMDRIIKNVLKF